VHSPLPRADLGRTPSQDPLIGLAGHRFRVVVLFLAAYLSIDYCNTLYPHELLSIPPWNPRAAIGLSLILLGGIGWAPLLFLGALITALLPAAHPAAAMAPDLAPLPEAIVYCGAAWLLKSRLRFQSDLSGFDDVFIFIGTVAVAAALMSAFRVLPCWIQGRLPQDEVLQPLFRSWVADMLGTLVLGPFLLVHRPTLQRLGRLKALLSWECVVLAALIGWILFIIFPRTVGSRFYPMFIPLVWIAARYGLTGVASALLPIQVAFVGCIVALGLESHQVVKLQILMLTLSITGLLLGAVISERERARRSVVQGEARLKAIIDMAPDGMVLVDEDGRIAMANRQFETLTAASAASILGKALDTVIAQPSPSRGGDMAVRRSDGSQVPVETSTSTIEIDGRHTHVFAVRDISERRRAAARLGQRRAQLETASRNNLTGELAAALAHELNQPLSAVITYTGACQRTLAGTDAPPRALEQLAKAAAQAERAGQVLRGLREFFRNAVVETQPVAVVDLVKDVLLLLVDEATRIGVQFDMAICDDLQVQVDRLQIEQVLVNLVRNSMDALETTGGDDRQIVLQARPVKNGLVEISVIDRGPGIDHEVAKDLFRPFTTTRRSGMGLGLAISRSLVEANGGQLWADDQSAPGASFRFTLPAATV
jgi:signal transduction histidine kinase